MTNPQLTIYHCSMTQNKTLKTILITFLFVGLLFSCKSKTPENKNQTSADNAEAKPSSEYNYPEIAKYATHINNLFAADDNLIGFWWDCSDIVIRKELTAHQEVIDGIMNCYENWPTYHKQGNGYIEESAFTAVKNMKTGWNMGNTLDSNSYVAIWDSENNQWLFILTDRQFILRSVGNGCPIWLWRPFGNCNHCFRTANWCVRFY